MQIKIQAPFEVNDYLRGIIKEKIEKLTTFHDRIHGADVFLKLKEASSHHDKCVEVNLSIPGKDAFASETAESFEKAVAAVAGKLEKQLKKKKEIQSKKY